MNKLNNLYFFQGKVIYGEKVGKTIGFPTANLDFLPMVRELKRGVYFGTVKISENSSKILQEYYCLAYFGPCYIFGEEKDNFEVFIYDFSREIYGEKLVGKLSHFIRPPKKLKGLEQLRSQLQHDMKIGYSLIPNH